MGTSLSYQSTAVISEPLRSKIIEFLIHESNQREWWAESLVLFDSPQLPGHIIGDTKLFCLIDDVAADCFMAMNDATFIVELLEAVSGSFDVDWNLSIAGRSCGRISKGKRDLELAATLGSFADLSESQNCDFADFERETLLAEYSDR